MSGFKEFAQEIRKRATDYPNATVQHVAIYAKDNNRVYIIDENGNLVDFEVADISCYNIDVSQTAQVGETLEVTGNAYLHSNAYIGGIIDVIGNGYFWSDVTIDGNLLANSNVSIGENLEVSGNGYFLNDVTVEGNLLVNSNVSMGVDLAVVGDVSISGSLFIANKLTVGGLIDPTGLELTPIATNPGGVAANTLWVNSVDTNRLYFGGTPVDNAGFVSAFYSKITDPAVISISGPTTATINRMHKITITAGDITINMPVSPNAGDVVGFYMNNSNTSSVSVATLDAGGTVKIADRTRYLALIQRNSALLMFNGTDWVALTLNLDTSWFNMGAVTPGAVTTPPTKGTVTVDRMWCRRLGDSAEFRYEYVQSAGGAVGSGFYLIPFGFTADAAKINIGTVTSVNQPHNCCGNGVLSGWTATVSLNDAQHVYAMMEREGTHAFWDHDRAAWTGAEWYQLRFTLPIVNW